MRGASRYAGRRHAGSGNQDRKGDVSSKGKSRGRSIVEHFLIEYKRTDKRQITVKADDLEQLQSQALSTGRTPVFGVEVGGRHYVLLREGDYDEMVGAGDG